VEIKGYYPGLVGQVVELHARYYAAEWGLDVSFETQVGRELSQFVAGLDPGKDGLWAAVEDGRLAGFVAIDGRGTGEAGARLRWFIVQPDIQGKGLGRRLLDLAVGFCRERGYPLVFLWTYLGLEAARRLYLRAGFKLTEEHRVAQWGQVIDEQRYDLVISPDPR